MEAKNRLWLIELLAYWEGRVNTAILQTYCDLSRQQCSNDINHYRRLYPRNLSYNTSRKAHLPTEQFTCEVISGDVAQYLEWLQNPAGMRAAPLPAGVAYAQLQLPQRSVEPLVMRGVVQAIKTGRRVDVDYVSLNNPNREGRIIAPHHLVNTGQRWHLRAWCEKSQNYRDFTLSRFRGSAELLGPAQHDAAGDANWNTQVTVTLQADPRLNSEKRAVMEHDYQMQNGLLHLPTRACLVNYLLRELQVSTKMWDGTPEAQQLVLVNRDDIKQWLFEG